AGSRVPAHLMTLECARAAARALAPGGVYTANVPDAVPLGFARGQAAAFAAAFAHIAVVAVPKVLDGPRFGNVLLIGSDSPLPEKLLVRRLAGDPFPARLLDDAAARDFAGSAVPPTDATATPSPRPPPGVFGRPP